MSELTELQECLRRQRPVEWEQLPDFPLYMDQVLSYMERQVIRFEGDDPLTAAMVNNYTKSGLLPRAEGKKYHQEHLAYLTAICILKRVMSTKDMDLLFREEVEMGRDIPECYRYFREGLDRILNGVADDMEQLPEEMNLADAAVHFALISYAAGVASSRYVAMLRQQKGEEEPKKAKKRKEDA